MMKLAGLALALAACVPDAPSAPSFQQHVLPILAANCVRCHGYPAIGGAPPALRLDTYGEIAVDETTTISGAGYNAAAIAARVTDDESPMPPRFGLDDVQRETLVAWAGDTPFGEAPPRGAPRAGNRAPTIAIERTERIGGGLAITSRVRDDDGDLVVGELRATVNGVDRIVGAVRSGLVEIAWETTAIAPGDYPLHARLDDGADVHVITLGNIQVEAP